MKPHTKRIRRSFKQSQRQAALFALCLLFVLSTRWAGSLAHTGAPTVGPASSAQARAGQGISSEIWQALDRTAVSTQRLLKPEAKASAWRLNGEALARLLKNAPLESRGKLKESAVILSLPLPDGNLQRFWIEESTVLEPTQAAKYPALKSYRGLGVDDHKATVRFSLTPRGFHAFILEAGGHVLVQPVAQGNETEYLSYHGRAAAAQVGAFTCGVEEVADQAAGLHRVLAPNEFPVGSSLRTYRIAIATTQEYSNDAFLGGGTLAGVNASLVIWLNSVNAIYERELSIHLNLAAGNDNAVKFAEPDGFTNGTTATMINQASSVLASSVGASNYDVGHVLGLGGGGQAYLGVVCREDVLVGFGQIKGGGATLVSFVGDSSGIFTLAHELGHQFGAHHTFNTNSGTCAGQRNAATAWEPGSGTTLMAYGGSCSPDVTPTGPEMRFHGGSFAQITTYLATTNCGTTAATGNNIPTVNGGADYHLPRNTPFTLSAAGSDADVTDLANLTYCWEQYDAGGTSYANPPYTDVGDPANTTRPLFRAFSPTSNPARVFPSLTYILNNANVPPATVDGFQTAENLPNVTRALNFRVTVRDQRGGVNYDAVQLTVDGSAGPFLVTQPNTAVTWTGGSTETITWSVNGTDAAPVNCANVRLLLSTDGGQNFPRVLAASTPNDGSESITVPSGLTSTQARVKVEAIGNLFFDLSDVNFMLTPGNACPASSSLTPLAGITGASVVISGVNFTGVTGVKFSNNVTASFVVNSNTMITATVPVGSVSGPLTLSKTGCAERLTGHFTVSTSCPLFQADDGSFETARAASGTIAYLVNRFTPTSYPATLTSVSLRFHSSFPVGSSFSLALGNNADGDANISGLSFQETAATVQTVSAFSTYTVTPYTINAGDFVVGFRYTPATGVFPLLADTTAPHQSRSYVSSSDGSGSFFVETTRDYGIRANYCLGAVPGAGDPVWTGAISTDWHTAGNWSNNQIPTATSKVTIPSGGVANEPLLSSNDVVVGSLTLETGRTLTITNARALVIASSATLNGALNTSGAVSVGGALSTVNSTVTFNGSAAQTIQSGSYNNLVINNAAGVTLGGNITVAGALTLTTDLNTNGNTLTLTGGCPAGTGDVIGNVRRSSLSNSTTYCFGNAENQITFNSGTPPTEFTINLAKSLPGTLGNAVTRLYTITPTGGSGYSATVRLHYLDSELNGLNEGVLQLWRHTGSAWESPWTQTRDGSANWVEASGVTAFSPWAIAGPSAPTAVQLAEFRADSNVQRNGASVPGVELRWRTGYEVDNLGFNVYREVKGARVRVNPALIAGSALLAGRTVLTAGLGYAWVDAQGVSGAQYWLEEVELNSVSRWYGPMGAAPRFAAEPEAPLQRSLTLAELNATANQAAQREWAEDEEAERQREGETGSEVVRVAAGGWAWAGHRAVKLSVKQAGWYRVTQAELAAAGFETNVNPALWQLFADGVEIPLNVVTGKAAVFGPGDAIEFYGEGVDTPTTDTRVYWLVSGTTPGRRLRLVKAAEATAANVASFLSTVERKDKLIYFSGLLNGAAENWFGPVISGSHTTVQTLDATAVERTASTATLEVAFQGVTATPHSVVVAINGQPLGTAHFADKDAHTAQFNVPLGTLTEGANEVRLTALGGSGDVSLVSAVRLRYARQFRAANNQLNFSLQAGQTAYVNGFSASGLRVLALDGASGQEELQVQVQREANGYGFFLYAPVNRRFVARADERLARVAGVKLNGASTWSEAKKRGDFVIFTHSAFLGAAQRLAEARKAQGFQPVVVDVEDAYDEFNFGARSPQALKDFLKNAHTNWQVKPRFVLLLGDGSTDPRDYLALGAVDFVPAKLLGLTYFETAADNWYADLNDDQIPELALGRLPVRTAAQAEAVITKLLSFNATDAARGALFVSDRVQDGYDYAAASQQLAGTLPAHAPRQFIKRTDGTPEVLRQQIIGQINQSPLLVNWQGHGSTQVWTGDGLLRTQDAGALTNAQLALFVMTTCLNGYFIDPQQSSLGEAVLLNTTGGAVSVIASSALGQPAAQLAFNQQLYQQLLTNRRTLGEALQLAKQSIADSDLRQSYTLFGDPTLRIVR